MFNGLALNPAYAGNQNQLHVTGLYRKQWLNMDGAPNTQTLSAHAGFKSKKVGVGLQVSRDEIGIHKDLSLYASYAYKLRLSSGTLALGLQGGFSQLSTDFNQLSIKFADPSLSGSQVNMSPNFGTGLFYSNKTTYIGLSVPYLLNNRLYDGNEGGSGSKSTESRYYFLTGGKVLEVNKQVKVVPSLLLRMQEGAPLGVDVNMMVMLNEVVQLGGSYRSSDAAVFFFQLQVDPSFRFGYAYDLTLSSLTPHTQGSHEFMLTYNIKLTKDRCHTYF
jgi:type IX secretion system PorP/SprF family membrane protein